MNTITSNVETNAPPRAASRGRRVLRRIGLGILGLIGVLISCAVIGIVYEAIMAPGDAQRYPPPGLMADAGGHQLHINCIGEGSPTVIFESGFGDSSTAWGLVQPEVGTVTRACSYDRAGYAWSEAGPDPRSPQQIASELHSLLINADVEGPYVLVGHSLGGKHIRMFAELYPDEVAGLAFVDARHESAEPVGRTPEQQAQGDAAYAASLNMYHVFRQFGIVRLLGTTLVRLMDPSQASLSDDMVYERALFAVRQATLDTMNAESRDSTDSDEQLHSARSLGDLPLIVLTADTSLQLQPGWDKVQQNLAALSTNSRWAIVANSSHNIHFDQPKMLVDAIRDVLESARTGQRLANK